MKAAQRAATAPVKGEKLVRDSIKNKHEMKPVYWKEIKEGITGYVRIIKYTNHSVPTVLDVDQMEKSGSKLINMKPENLEIDDITEGQFKNGMKDGYCRVMHAKDGACEVGFFQKDAPMGKYCMYKADGTYIL